MAKKMADAEAFKGISCNEAVSEYCKAFDTIPIEFEIMLNRTCSAMEITDRVKWEAGVKAGWYNAQTYGTSNYNLMKHEQSFEFLVAFHSAAMLYQRYKPDWPHW